MIRAQYYFRDSEEGLLAWDVRRLDELSRRLPVETIKLRSIAEQDEEHWYSKVIDQAVGLLCNLGN